MTTPVWNVAAAYNNIALNGTVTASSAATNMPASLLQQEDTRRVWRSGAGTSASISIAFAATQSADTFCILGMNLTAAGTVRVKLSNISLGSFDVWDSGTLTGLVDPLYLTALVLSSVARTGWKYCTIDFADTSLSYIEAGFLFISTRSQFSINRSYGANRTVVDPSTSSKTKGGQTKVRPLPKFRQWEFAVDFLTATERWALVEAMDIANGISTPVLFILDPSSTNLGRDSIFGFLQESGPVTEIQAFGSDGLNMFSRPYKIAERL